MDLDGTLTVGPKLFASTYKALEELKNAGFWTVIVSGRPAGWADCLMRLTPIDAMIFENGAGVLLRDGEKLVLHPLAPNPGQARQALQSVFEKLKKAKPYLRQASDQAYRLYDCAVDICEEEPHLSEKDVEWLLETLKKEKVTAKLSSIHVNFWKGNHDKRSACEFLLKSEGKKWKADLKNVVFLGDSPNDEPLFEYFPNSVGVANVRDFEDKLIHRPKFVTNKAGGKGFEELVRVLKA